MKEQAYNQDKDQEQDSRTQCQSNLKKSKTIKKKKSLDYNNSFLGEYEYSFLALDREKMRGEKEETGSLETRSNNVSDQAI
ncbi:hypothetical protein Tco_0271391 [Tanacetum coccineum]